MASKRTLEEDEMEVEIEKAMKESVQDVEMGETADLEQPPKKI